MAGYRYRSSDALAVATVDPVAFRRMTPHQRGQLARRRAMQVQAAGEAHERQFGQVKRVRETHVSDGRPVDFHTLSLLSLAVAILDNMLEGAETTVPVAYQCRHHGCTSWERWRGLCSTHAKALRLSA